MLRGIRAGVHGVHDRRGAPVAQRCLQPRGQDPAASAELEDRRARGEVRREGVHELRGKQLEEPVSDADLVLTISLVPG